MKKFIITITRQFGSLGRPIAKELAELLHVEYYDRDIVDEASKKLGMPVSTISNEEEQANIKFFSMRYPLGMGTTEKQNEIYRAEAEIIKDIAARESCIIVGRCSDYILKDREDVVNIYIYAPYEARMKNCVEILNMTEDDAAKSIQQVDKARDHYHRTYAKYLPADPNYKNIMIDSSLLGVDGTAKILADIIKMKFGDDKN